MTGRPGHFFLFGRPWPFLPRMVVVVGMAACLMTCRRCHAPRPPGRLPTFPPRAWPPGRGAGYAAGALRWWASLTADDRTCAAGCRTGGVAACATRCRDSRAAPAPPGAAPPRWADVLRADDGRRRRRCAVRWGDGRTSATAACRRRACDHVVVWNLSTAVLFRRAAAVRRSRCSNLPPALHLPAWTVAMPVPVRACTCCCRLLPCVSPPPVPPRGRAAAFAAAARLRRRRGAHAHDVDAPCAAPSWMVVRDVLVPLFLHLGGVVPAFLWQEEPPPAAVTATPPFLPFSCDVAALPRSVGYSSYLWFLYSRAASWAWCARGPNR